MVSFSAPNYHITTSLGHCIITLPHHHIITLTWYGIIFPTASPHYHIIALLHQPSIVSFSPPHYCITASPHHCITASLHQHVTMSQHYCITALLHYDITALTWNGIIFLTTSTNYHVNVTEIDHKVLSLIYPAMNSYSLLSWLWLITVNHLFTLSYPHLFQIWYC